MIRSGVVSNIMRVACISTVAVLLLTSFIQMTGIAAETLPLSAQEKFNTAVNKPEKPSSVSLIYFNYKPWYKTIDYECWDLNGNSLLWNGTSYVVGYDTVKNAAVVRQGMEVYFTAVGSTPSSSVIIKGPKDFSGSRTIITSLWNPTHVCGETWKLTVPGNAEIGDYQVIIDGEHATLYVIFNTFKWRSGFTAKQWSSWGYDENTSADEITWSGPYPRYLTRGMPYKQRMVEFVCSVMGAGVARETDAIAVLSIIAQKRIYYSNDNGLSERNLNSQNILDGNMTHSKLPLSVNDGRYVVEDSSRYFSSDKVLNAFCSHYAAFSFGMFKSVGIITRMIFDNSGTWGWTGYHNWLECYVPDTHKSVNATFNGWLTVDNTRQKHSGGVDSNCNGSPAFDTQPEYAFLAYALGGKGTPGCFGTGGMNTFVQRGVPGEEYYSTWDDVDVILNYWQEVSSKAQNNLPTLTDRDVARGYLSEGDRDFFRVKISGSADSVTLKFLVGKQYAQIYARLDCTVSMSPMNSTSKTAYLFDAWSDDDLISFPVPGAEYLYVMVDNAKGSQYADDYVDGEIRCYEIMVMLNGGSLPSPTVPSAVRALHAQPVNSSICLSWGPPVTSGGSMLLGYKIYRGISPGSYDPTPIATITGWNTTTYNDHPYANGTYYYVVKAYNAVGEGAPSNEAYASVIVPYVIPEHLGLVGISTASIIIVFLFLAKYCGMSCVTSPCSRFVGSSGRSNGRSKGGILSHNLKYIRKRL